MKRIQFHRYGGPEEMRLENYWLPDLADNEVLVKIEAASINPVDFKIRRGDMKFLSGRKFPRGMGQDFSGIVEAVGSKVTLFRIGDAVLGGATLKTSGTFAEKLIIQDSLVVAKPATLSFEDAATLPVVAGVSWTALVYKAGLKPGQSVFINGAYGSVGQAATQIAKALGASVTARVAADAMEAAKAIGADTVLDYKQPVPTTLYGQFDVVFDTHGSLTVADGGKLAKSGGVILDISPSPSKLFRILLSRKRKFVMGRQDVATLQAVVAFASEGKLNISIGRTVPLSAGIDLIKALEAGERIGGKGVIVPVKEV